MNSKRFRSETGSLPLKPADRNRDFAVVKTPTQCRIVLVGKRRDGGKKYWCLEHRADATAKYGRRAKHCRQAHLLPIGPRDTCSVRMSQYPGGIAIWGAVSPVFDTTRLPVPTGVHVHAREVPDGGKELDDTYRRVALLGPSTPSKGFVISDLDAVYFMVSSVFGFKVKHVVCTECGCPHLDKDWFSVHKHQTHLCAGCGKTFRDSERSIGNPVAIVQDTICKGRTKVAPANRNKNIDQRDYAGGLQIWGSNPAIVWTAERHEEEGIHLHAFDEHNKIKEDDTFSELVIDGIKLDSTMVRVFMAQSALPHIEGRVVDLSCPRCDFPHFDSAEHAFSPHEVHLCGNCGYTFRNRGRLRKTIGNPTIGLFARLSKTAPRRPRQHKSDLLVEKI